ncbi:hypothetical protein P3T33_005213, partial [Rhizobium sp. AN67]|nr:hypothetical protein [Rhizobium sp. AN67]
YLSSQSNIDERKPTACNMRPAGNIVLIHFAPDIPGKGDNELAPFSCIPHLLAQVVGRLGVDPSNFGYGSCYCKMTQHVLRHN